MPQSVSITLNTLACRLPGRWKLSPSPVRSLGLGVGLTVVNPLLAPLVLVSYTFSLCCQEQTRFSNARS